jgi:hypothetical protein
LKSSICTGQPHWPAQTPFWLGGAGLNGDVVVDAEVEVVVTQSVHDEAKIVSCGVGWLAPAKTFVTESAKAATAATLMPIRPALRVRNRDTGDRLSRLADRNKTNSS